MLQYMLSVHHVSDDNTTYPAPDRDVQEMIAAVDAFNTALTDAGAMVFGGGLHPPATATTVRVQGDDLLVTDGPFAETKEFLGGFWVIKAADLDEALGWARQAAAAVGPVEVRPFQEEVED